MGVIRRFDFVGKTECHCRPRCSRPETADYAFGSNPPYRLRATRYDPISRESW